MMEFCKDFNAKTSLYRPTALMRVKLTAFEDRLALQQHMHTNAALADPICIRNCPIIL